MTKIDRTIQELDLEPIKFKLVKEENWSIEQADKVEEEYKGYLHLCKEYPHLSIVPTELIDDFWHTHILDTAKYIEDCNVVFGSYLHHFPYVGLRGKEDESNLNEAFEITKALFEHELCIPLTSKMAGSTCGSSKCGDSSCSSHNCYTASFAENTELANNLMIGGKQFQRVPFNGERPRLERPALAA